MGRLRSIRRGVSAVVIAGALSLALAGCENNLMTYLMKGILYRDWKVASWSTAAPVVDGQTHVIDEALSNGYPMNMAMGTNGKLHLIGWRFHASDWVYTSKEPEAARFEQSFTVVNSTPGPDDYGRSPGMDLVTEDFPIIAYGVGYTGATHYLYYQEYMGSWGSAQPIQTNSSSVRYAPVSVYLFSDLESHIWYLESGKIKHTLANPVSPVEWLSGIGTFTTVRLGPSDVGFAYTDTANTQLSYRTWTGSSSTPLWTAPADVKITELTLARDSKGAVYVCFGTKKTSDPDNPAHFTLRCYANSSGEWRELDSIDPSATAGPVAPNSITVAPDRYGNDHLHMVYTTWELPYTLSVWYTYYEETGWHAPQNLDTLHNSVYPQIAVDPAGTVHVVYTWWAAEGMTTLMYVRGTPAEPQNQ